MDNKSSTFRCINASLKCIYECIFLVSSSSACVGDMKYEMAIIWLKPFLIYFTLKFAVSWTMFGILLFEALDVLSQIVPVHLHSVLLVGELVHYSPEFSHLILVQITDPRRAFAPHLLQLRDQDLILLLQKSHFIYETGKPVVEMLHLRFLIGSVGFKLGVDGVGEPEVQSLGGESGHRRAPAHPRALAHVGWRRGGRAAVGHARGCAHRAAVLPAGVSGPKRRWSLSSEHPFVRRCVCSAGHCNPLVLGYSWSQRLLSRTTAPCPD